MTTYIYYAFFSRLGLSYLAFATVYNLALNVNGWYGLMFIPALFTIPEIPYPAKE